MRNASSVTWLLATALLVAGCATAAEDTVLASPSSEASTLPIPTEPAPTDPESTSSTVAAAPSSEASTLPIPPGATPTDPESTSSAAPPLTPAATSDATAGVEASTAPVPHPAPTVPSETPDASPTPSPVADVVITDPERLLIPAIDVEAPIIDLGLDDQGVLEVPSDWDVTGWWTGGVPPGHVGPAVIAGHIDSTNGPAVFFRLNELMEGDEIMIAGADGSMVTYEVERTDEFPKNEFPTTEVYGPTTEATLRLITCGGPFDEAWGHYLHNVVVYATQVSATA